MTSTVEKLIHDELSNNGDLEKIEGGYRYTIDEGFTDIVFRNATEPSCEFGLCAIATVESSFLYRMPTFETEDLERLNRRAVFGNFFQDKGTIKSKLSYSIYEEEPADRFVALILLRALGEQLALGIGLGHSELSDRHLRDNRANLEYPRQWVEAPPDEAFEEGAKRFRDIGIVSTHGTHGLVAEIDLSGSSPSRMLEPNAETALLHVSIDAPHPVAGVGYLCTIALPINPSRDDVVRWATFLNEEEHRKEDFVPRLGAWGLRGLGDELVYSMFWPTEHGDQTMHMTMMNWMVQRMVWVKDRFWKPGFGFEDAVSPHA